MDISRLILDTAVRYSIDEMKVLLENNALEKRGQYSRFYWNVTSGIPSQN
jgi:hypothetical protein